MCLWPIRRNLRMVRVAVTMSLIALHLVMKAPVWWLISRIDLTGSSSSFHRAALVDQFIQHFGSWWLIGTNEAATWGYDLWDQQNEYVGVGETGGLLALILFIVMIKRACAWLGNARKKVDGQRKEALVWFMGASLFSTLVGFFGINYYDQVKVGWFLLLAIISVATSSIMQVNNSDGPQDVGKSLESFPSVPASSGIDWTQVVLHGDEGLRIHQIGRAHV